MNSVYLAFATSFIKWYVGTGVYDRIAQLVKEMVNSDKTNSEKRDYVIQKTKEEFSLIKTRVIDIVIGSVLETLEKKA